MKTSLAALSLALSFSAPALANEGDGALADDQAIVVTGHHADDRIDLPPATRTRVTAAEIATKINALAVEDTLKYAPSLIIRKRHIGDNFAPIATRTSGLGSSARSLIYADGVLLSALIANNNGNGSPRWTLVTPEEIDRVDVLYGPFSAAYPGNAIGTTVNITTRQPQQLEASFRAVANVQQFELYGTRRTLPTHQVSATIGDKVGPLSLFAAFTRTDAKSQPVSVTTFAGTANPKDSAGVFTLGGYADVNRTGAAIRVIGVGGLEHHVQDTVKLKAALDLGRGMRLSYLFGRWADDTAGGVESYLRNGSTGLTSYLTGNGTTTSAFNSATYWRDARHSAHAVTIEGTGERFDWHVVATSYHYDRDLQSNPASSNALPGALSGGAGTVQRQDGTGWITLDAKAAWRPTGSDRHVISLGGHVDRYRINTRSFAETNWLDAATQGAVAATVAHGRTRTAALWLQDRLDLGSGLVLTLGARQEWWRAWDGVNQTTAGTVIQPERRFTGFSPKAALEWKPASHWSARLSLGQAWRMPTVGELYQATTVGTTLANPNPTLRPERARSAELAIERRDSHGALRLSLFNEVVDGALISQTNLASGIATSFVQNVDQTRARGIELVLERRNLIPRVDLSASATYADAITTRDAAFPAAVGKLLPSVPRWKANVVATWRPDERVALTAAWRMASRHFATLDNSDTVGNTYQGFWKYSVVDLRARFAVNDHFELALGVDNLGNDTYFLFHPFPQRNVTVQAGWKL